MIDRFGLLPEPTKTLFSITRVKLLVQELGIKKLDMNAIEEREEWVVKLMGEIS